MGLKSTGKRILRYKKQIGAVISLVLLASFLYWIAFFDNLHIVFSLPVHILLLVLGLNVIGVLVRAFRFDYLADTMDIKLHKKKNIMIHFVSMLFGLLTPFRIGEGGKLVFYKHSKKTLLFCHVLERCYDFLILSLFGLVGILYLNTYTNLIPFILSLVCVGILGLYNIDWVLKFFFKKKSINWFHDHFKQMNPNQHGIVFLFTLTMRMISFTSMFILGKGFALTISFMQTISMYSVASIVSYMTLLPEGLGVQEISFTWMLVELMNISKEVAGIYSLGIRLLVIIVYIVCGIWGYSWLQKHH